MSDRKAIESAMRFNKGSSVEDAIEVMEAVAKYYDDMPDGAFVATMQHIAWFLLYHPHGPLEDDVSNELFELWLEETAVEPEEASHE